MPVDAWLAAQTPETAAAIQRLRAIVSAASPDLSEEIKWNAPSYSDAGEDRITLGVERKGGVRIVLHRGAAKSDPSGFMFDDPHGLAAWPSPDRGVVRFADAAAVDASAEPLTDLIARWIAATRI